MAVVTCPRDKVRCEDDDLPPGDLVGSVSRLRVLDVELPAQWVEDGGIGLPVLGVPLLRSVGLLERPQESDRCGVVSRLSVWRVGDFRLRV